MSALDDLLAAKRAADEALAEAEAGLVEAYEQAADSYRQAPGSDAKREAYRQAGAELAGYREVQREHRDGMGVHSDMTVVPDQTPEG